MMSHDKDLIIFQLSEVDLRFFKVKTLDIEGTSDGDKAVIGSVNR